MSARGSIALDSSHDSKLARRSATAKVCVKWASARVLQVGAWVLADSLLQRQNLSNAWTRFALLAVACTGSVSKAHAPASKVGKAPIVKTLSVRTTAPVMANVLSSQSTALGNASATMAGAGLVARGQQSTHSSRLAQMIAEEMACAWMACAHATLASRVQIALTQSAQQDWLGRSVTSRVARMIVAAEDCA